MASYTAFSRSPWGWARAVLLLGAGALTYAGCSVDDRVLTNDGRGAAGGAGTAPAAAEEAPAEETAPEAAAETEAPADETPAVEADAPAAEASDEGEATEA